MPRNITIYIISWRRFQYVCAELCSQRNDVFENRSAQLTKINQNVEVE